MNLLSDHLLSIATLLPALGAVLLLLIPAAQARVTALAASVATALVVFRAVALFVPSDARVQLVERAPWIPTLHIEYLVGVDGFSAALLVLTAVLVPVVILASRQITDRSRTYFALVLLLQTALLGAFTALSFFLWFLYWELSLVPAYFLVKMWGGKHASRAALTFFLYTLVGSITLLLTFQAIYLATGSFDFLTLRELGRSGELSQRLADLVAGAGISWNPRTVELVAFLAVALAFFIKTPLWPVHTWLPETYAEAPTPVTMLLTGALSKLGVYGLLRIALPLFPQAASRLSGALTALAVLTIVAGAFAALRQTDLKRTMAYSSMSHVGFCLLGAFVAAGISTNTEARVAALDGAVVQMFNHGISGAALFFFVHLLETRTRLRGIDDFGGLRTTAPALAFSFALVLFASLGLPGLSGFIGELLVFKGALALSPWLTALASVGLIVTAVYCLRIVQHVCWGPVAGRSAEVADLDAGERVVSAVLCGLVLLCGLWPALLTNACNSAVQALIGSTP